MCVSVMVIPLTRHTALGLELRLVAGLVDAPSCEAHTLQDFRSADLNLAAAAGG
jgi:hypothetical protein